MNPLYDFTGRAAFVTGASSGMGLATARAFAEAGAAVGLADIDENAVRKAAKELTDAGLQALALVCDVTDESQVAAAVDRTVETPRQEPCWWSRTSCPLAGNALDDPARGASWGPERTAGSRACSMWVRVTVRRSRTPSSPPPTDAADESAEQFDRVQNKGG